VLYNKKLRCWSQTDHGSNTNSTILVNLSSETSVPLSLHLARNLFQTMIEGINRDKLQKFHSCPTGQCETQRSSVSPKYFNRASFPSIAMQQDVWAPLEITQPTQGLPGLTRLGPMGGCCRSHYCGSWQGTMTEMGYCLHWSPCFHKSGRSPLLVRYPQHPRELLFWSAPELSVMCPYILKGVLPFRVWVSWKPGMTPAISLPGFGSRAHCKIESIMIVEFECHE
jgi:hypothetical protein